MAQESNYSRNTAIGQLFIVSYRGAELPEAFSRFLQEERIGGVILFADNCPTHDAARESIRKIQDLYPADMPPFIAIDQEGGRVSRLKGAPAEFHSAAEYGEKLGLEAFKQDYSRSAMYMESLGINLNFAPVCDLFLNPKNSCMKGRCFGDDPKKVSEFVRAAIGTARHYGLLSCCKHFPGLGDSVVDPHLGASDAAYTMDIFTMREQIPFQTGVDADVDMIMTTHLTVPSLDSIMATGSKRIVTNILREQMDFDGVIITDDLTMGGAAPLGSIGERSIAALQAGHDILLFGQDFVAAESAYRAVCRAVEDGTLAPELIDQAARRISGLKSTLRRVHIA